MGKILRLIITFAIVAILIAILEPQGVPIEPLIGAIGVGFIFYIFWDLLEILDFSDIIMRIKEFLFYLCAIFMLFIAFVASYQELFGEYADYYTYTQIQQVAICGSMPAAIATLIICVMVDYFDLERVFSPYPMIGGILIGGIIGYIIQMLNGAGNVVLLAVMILVMVAGIIFLVKFTMDHGFIFDTDGTGLSFGSSSSSSSGGSSYLGGSGSSRSSSSSSYGSTTRTNSTYSEWYSDVDYQMSDIAYRYSTSRNCSYGVSVRFSVSHYLSSDTISFTVDMEIDQTCCSATTQSEYNWVLSDLKKYQQEIMNDIFNSAKGVISRAKSRYSDFYGLNLEVNPGNVTEY